MRDGRLVDKEAGSDVKNGSASIKENRLYHLIHEVTPGEHTLEIIIENPGLHAFTFTFG